MVLGFFERRHPPVAKPKLEEAPTVVPKRKEELSTVDSREEAATIEDRPPTHSDEDEAVEVFADELEQEPPTDRVLTIEDAYAGRFQYNQPQPNEPTVAQPVSVEEPPTDHSGFGSQADAWFKTNSTPEHYATEMPEEPVEKPQGRFGQLLSRGWERVRTRVNTMFPEKNTDNSKHRLNAKSWTLGVFGAMAISGLVAHETEGFKASALAWANDSPPTSPMGR